MADILQRRFARYGNDSGVCSTKLLYIHYYNLFYRNQDTQHQAVSHDEDLQVPHDAGRAQNLVQHLFDVSEQLR